jgi:hypothetical protein
VIRKQEEGYRVKEEMSSIWFSKYSFMLGMATVLLVLFSMWD